MDCEVTPFIMGRNDCLISFSFSLSSSISSLLEISKFATISQHLFGVCLGVIELNVNDFPVFVILGGHLRVDESLVGCNV